MFTVTFDIGNGTLVSGDLVQEVEEGASAEAPVIDPPEGYTFIEWDASFDNVADDITVNAVYEQITNTVTFDIGDGTLVSGDLVQQVVEGEDAVAPTIEAPEGFEFVEWDTNFTNVQDDITVTAVYEPIEYVVTFDIGDGTLVSGDLVQTIQHGGDAVAPTITPTVGFEFVEWDAAFTNVQGDITVTAVYEQITNTVTFDIGNGQRTGGGDLVQTVDYGEAAVAPLLNSPEGFEFVEWDVSFDNVTDDILVNALYEPIEYTVTFDLGDGALVSGDLVQTVQHGSDAAEPVIEAPEGYAFIEWDTDFTNVTDDILVNALYEPIEYTVTFEIGTGTLVSGDLVQEVAYGEAAIAPVLNAPDGYSFIEWDTDFTNVTNDITVRAVYESILEPSLPLYGWNSYTQTYWIPVGYWVTDEIEKNGESWKEISGSRYQNHLDTIKHYISVHGSLCLRESRNSRFKVYD